MISNRSSRDSQKTLEKKTITTSENMNRDYELVNRNTSLSVPINESNQTTNKENTGNGAMPVALINGNF